MKKLLLAAAVLLAFGAAASVVFGNLRAHSAHRDLLEGVQQEGAVRIVEERFAPGVLGASSLVRLEIQRSAEDPDTAGGAAEPVGFRMESRIEHGAGPLLAWLGAGGGGTPVVAQAHTTLSLDGAARAKLEELLGEIPPLEIDTTVRASGVGEAVFRMRPRAGEGAGEGGGFGFDWKGLDGRIVFTEDLGQVAGRFRSGGLEVDTGLLRFGARALEGTLDYEAHESGLPVGRWAFSLAAAEFEPTLVAGPGFSLTSWRTTQTSRVEAGRYEVGVSHEIESVKVGEATYGPARLEFGIRNLDAASIGRVRQQLTGFPSGELDPETRDAVAGQLLELLPALVAHSPEVELSEISVTTPEGLVRGDFKLVVDGAQAERLTNPLALASALSADAAAEMPAEIFASLVDVWAAKQVAARAASGEIRVGRDSAETLAYVRDSLIHNLRKSGYVIFDGGRYRTRVAWSGGSLEVNGLPVNPLELGALTASGAGGGGLGFPEPAAPAPDPLLGDDFPAALGD